MFGKIHLAIHGILVGVILALLVYINGFWFIDGLQDKLDRCRDRIAKAQLESVRATAVSSTVARNEDKAHDQNLAVTMPAAQRYIASHRVRQNSYRPGSQVALPSSAGQATTVPVVGEGGDPGPVPDTATDSDWVAVKPEDIEICTVAFEYSWTAYSTFQRLKEEDLVEPVTRTSPEPAF